MHFISKFRWTFFLCSSLAEVINKHSAIDWFLAGYRHSSETLMKPAALIIVKHFQELENTSGMRRIRDTKDALFHLMKLGINKWNQYDTTAGFFPFLYYLPRSKNSPHLRTWRLNLNKDYSRKVVLLISNRKFGNRFLFVYSSWAKRGLNVDFFKSPVEN